MNVIISAASESVAIGCAHALLFRDNVQHHLQGGLPGPEYPLIHALADAVAFGGVVQLGADELWSEVSPAFERIRTRGIDELAVSIRTQAVLTNRSAPIVRGTVLARLTKWRLPIVTNGVFTLGGFFEGFVNGLDLLTRSGTAGRVVCVTRRDGNVRPFTAGRRRAEQQQ